MLKLSNVLSYLKQIDEGEMVDQQQPYQKGQVNKK
jgi:hypothetical protein